MSSQGGTTAQAAALCERRMHIICGSSLILALTRQLYIPSEVTDAGTVSTDLWIRQQRCDEISNIDICPGELLIAQELPEQLEMVGCRSNRMKGAPEAIKKLEKR